MVLPSKRLEHLLLRHQSLKVPACITTKLQDTGALGHRQALDDGDQCIGALLVFGSHIVLWPIDHVVGVAPVGVNLLY